MWRVYEKQFPLYDELFGDNRKLEGGVFCLFSIDGNVMIAIFTLAGWNETTEYGYRQHE